MVARSDAQRAALVETGLRIVHERGFTATGVREIAAAAGVPQGSFTNHFRSKDAFGLLLLDRYAERLDAAMEATLRDRGRQPRDRLRAYFDAVERQLAEREWRTGCLVADLAGEIPVHSEPLRERLRAVLARQVESFAAVLADLAPEGRDARASADGAGFVVAAWQGTLLRMKVERGPEPLLAFRRALERWLDGVEGTRPASGSHD